MQEAVRTKRKAKKKWDKSQEEEDREEYKRVKRETKKAVAQAKARAYQNLYEELETKEGQKIYQLAKVRNRATRDISHVRQIKDSEGRVLRKEEEAKTRWREYFERLSNEEFERVYKEDGMMNEGMTRNVSKIEVEKAVKKMKARKSVGPDKIPVEASICYGTYFKKFYSRKKYLTSGEKAQLSQFTKGKGTHKNVRITEE